MAPSAPATDGRARLRTAWRRAVPMLRWLLLIAGVALLVYLVAEHNVAATIRQLGWWLVGGACILQIALLVASLRYAVVVRAMGGTLTPAKSIQINYSSFFYYFFTPFSVGLEAARIVKLSASDPKVTPVRAGVAGALDRLVGASGFLIVFIVLAPFVVTWQHLGWMAGAVAVVGLISLVFVRVIARRIAGARDIMLLAWQRRYAVGLAFVLSACSQGFIYLSVWVSAHGLEQDISIFGVMFAISGGMLAQVVPVNIAGVGALELASAILYPLTDISVGEGVILIASLYVSRLATACIGGCVELVDVVRARKRTRERTNTPAGG